MSFNTSIQMLTVGWNAKRFAESKSTRTAARRSVFRAATSKSKPQKKIILIYYYTFILFQQC